MFCGAAAGFCLILANRAGGRDQEAPLFSVDAARVRPGVRRWRLVSYLFLAAFVASLAVAILRL
jgi:hypothetical protein